MDVTAVNNWVKQELRGLYSVSRKSGCFSENNNNTQAVSSQGQAFWFLVSAKSSKVDLEPGATFVCASVFLQGYTCTCGAPNI